MKREFKGGIEPSLDDLQKQEEAAYQEVITSADKRDELWREINKIFADTPDRAKAEKRVMKEYGDQLDQLEKGSNEAIDRWLELITRVTDCEAAE
jgi:hypothetical protein